MKANLKRPATTVEASPKSMKLLFTMDLTKVLLYKKGAAGVGRPSFQNIGFRISDLQTRQRFESNPKSEIYL